MVFGTNAMTTINTRSFAGLVVAHLAVTLVVCGGLVLLLPTPSSASGMPTIAVVPAPDCAASGDRAGDQQFTVDDAGLDAPDSCDDDDDDDDAPSGSDAAIAVDECRTCVRGDALHVVHVKLDPWISRTVDGHSLRGPPRDDETSSDLDDIDTDDDDPSAESSDLPAPATSRETRSLRPAEFLDRSSTRSTSRSLRAPPV